MSTKEPYAVPYEEAAELLRCSPRTITRRVKAGKLTKVGRNWITMRSIREYTGDGDQQKGADRGK